MKTIYNPDKNTWKQLLKRPTQTVGDIEGIVNQVFEDVQAEGDSALNMYTQRFDRVDIDTFQVTTDEIEAATAELSENLKVAIQQAKTNIEAFHKAQKTPKVEVETMEGVTCWQEKKAIQKVGLYIPGGTAPLFSTILMLAVPAKIAGCEEIILCSPPNAERSLHPAILYTAKLCGVTKIFKIGGIQAVAAMTFGTESIPQAYKIFGPGNQYVTVAKQVATKFGVAIDMPAGPSELLVLADGSSNATFVAADLLSQAEHGTDSQVIMVSLSKEKLEEVAKEVETQLAVLPRKEIAERSIANSKLIFVDNEEDAMALVNEYGPEHLIISVNDEAKYLDAIINAGSVFIGNFTPESAGDYASGTNHTLPTNGYAKQYSGVNLDSFLKSITYQKISREGIQKIGNTIEIMAEAEGLQAHKNAVTLRLKSIDEK